MYRQLCLTRILRLKFALSGTNEWPFWKCRDGGAFISTVTLECSIHFGVCCTDVENWAMPCTIRAREKINKNGSYLDMQRFRIYIDFDGIRTSTARNTVYVTTRSRFSLFRVDQRRHSVLCAHDPFGRLPRQVTRRRPCATSQCVHAERAFGIVSRPDTRNPSAMHLSLRRVPDAMSPGAALGFRRRSLCHLLLVLPKNTNHIFPNARSSPRAQWLPRASCFHYTASRDTYTNTITVRVVRE